MKLYDCCLRESTAIRVIPVFSVNDNGNGNIRYWKCIHFVNVNDNSNGNTYKTVT